MLGRPSWRFTEVDSTQNVAFRLAELGGPHGTVVRADYQTAGRGRQGRSWDSPPGSALMFTVLLRPKHPLHTLGPLSIQVADALADVFSSYTSGPLNIKWPNDVMIDGQKVSGILLQTRPMPSPVAVLGIGVNVDTPIHLLPPNATSLAQNSDSRVDIDTVFSDVVHSLDELWRLWQPELEEHQIATIESRLWQLGQEVSLLDANREIRGQIAGITNHGALRLLDQDGEHLCVAGEIMRGPRPIDPSESR